MTGPLDRAESPGEKGPPDDAGPPAFVDDPGRREEVQPMLDAHEPPDLRVAFRRGDERIEETPVAARTLDADRLAVEREDGTTVTLDIAREVDRVEVM
jgi:hypothetical protein